MRSKHKATTLASCADSDLFILEKDQPQDLSVEGMTADVLCERVNWIQLAYDKRMGLDYGGTLKSL